MENPKNDVSTHSLEKLIDRCEFWVQLGLKIVRIKGVHC